MLNTSLLHISFQLLTTSALLLNNKAQIQDSGVEHIYAVPLFNISLMIFYSTLNMCHLFMSVLCNTFVSANY